MINSRWNVLFLLGILYLSTGGLRAADSTVEGRVTRHDSTGVSARVVLRHQTNHNQVYEADTDPEGYYTITGVSTSVFSEQVDIPDAFELYANYPNPGTNQTHILFGTPAEAAVKLRVYNIKGQTVDDVVASQDFKVGAGVHGIDYTPPDLAAGVYLYTVEAFGKTLAGRFVSLGGGGTSRAQVFSAQKPASDAIASVEVGKKAAPNYISKSSTGNDNVYTVEITPNDSGTFESQTLPGVVIQGDTAYVNVTVDDVVNGGALSFSFNEDGTQTLEENVSSPVGIRVVRYKNVPSQISVENVSGTDSTKVSGNLDQNGSYQFIREVETTHGTVREYNAFVDISEMDDIRGFVTDHQHDVRRPGVIKVDGLEFPIETDGTFDLQVAPKDSHEVKARQYDNGNPYSFIRTVDVPGNGDVSGQRIAVVDYTGLTPGDTTGVTPEKFKTFARELNFDRQLNCEYEGLKKFDYDSLVVWVAYDNNWNSDTFTVEQQERVRDRFINEILPNFLGRDVKDVYMEDRNNPETHPNINSTGGPYAVQAPNNSIPGDGEAGVFDREDDGSLDLGGASYRSQGSLPTNGIIDEEGATSIGAAGIPTVLSREQSVFAANGAAAFTVYDTKFGHILGEITYLPKESVERILGMPPP